MLKITLEVSSGTQHIVVPDKVKGSYLEKFNLTFKPENRHLFLKGILLFLMGEKISLYALNNKIKDDNLWQEQQQKLNQFLESIELKACLVPHVASYNLMAFSQHRKHGVPLYAMQQFDGNQLVSIKETRLNKRYADFIAGGLFDGFRLTPCKVKPVLSGSNLVDLDVSPVQTDMLFKQGSWLNNKTQIINMLMAVLQDETSFQSGNLTLAATEKLLAKLNDIFVLLAPDNKQLTPDGNSYNHIMAHIEGMQTAVGYLKKKNSGYAEEDKTPEQQAVITSAINAINSTEAAFTYFFWRYLKMYQHLYLQENKGKAPNCTKFGLTCLDFKTSKGLQAFLTWLNEPAKAFSDKPNQNSNTEYYKGVFEAPKYGVSSRAPVLTKRYDGVFELYVNADIETENLITERIKTSGRQYLRVGKLCLAQLAQPPARIPPAYWQTIVDDTVQT